MTIPPLAYLPFFVLLRALVRQSCLPSYEPLSSWWWIQVAPAVIMPLLESTQNLTQFWKWIFDSSSLCACESKLKFNGSVIGSKLLTIKQGYFTSGNHTVESKALKIIFNLGFCPILLTLRRNFGRNAACCNQKRCQLHAWRNWWANQCWLLQWWINVYQYIIIHKHIFLSFGPSSLDP